VDLRTLQELLANVGPRPRADTTPHRLGSDAPLIRR
jgi:hypothetical protein